MGKEACSLAGLRGHGPQVADGPWRRSGGLGGDPVRAQQSAGILGPSCPQVNSQVPRRLSSLEYGCCRTGWHARTPGRAHVARPAWASTAQAAVSSLRALSHGLRDKL